MALAFTDADFKQLFPEAKAKNAQYYYDALGQPNVAEAKALIASPLPPSQADVPEEKRQNRNGLRSARLALLSIAAKKARIAGYRPACGGIDALINSFNHVTDALEALINP